MEELARISRLKSSLYSAFLVGVAVIASVGIGLFDRLDLVAYDLALRTEKIPGEGPKIVVIGISPRDSKDDDLGAYPWSREAYARALGNLQKAGVAAVGFDLPFPAARDAEGDEAFERALAGFRAAEGSGRGAALSVYSSVNLNSTRLVPDQTFVVSEVQQIEMRERKLFREGRYVLSPEEIHQNIASLTAAAGALGHINVMPDSDGIVRTAPAALEETGTQGKRTYYPLAAEVVRLSQGIAASGRTYDGEFLRIGKTEIPVSGQGLIQIKPLDFERAIADMSSDESAFLANTRPILYYGFDALYKGQIPEDRLRGRIVFIGRTAHGQDSDLHATPFGQRFGVFLHAMLARTILERDFLCDANVSPTWKMTGTLLLTLVSALLFFRVRTRACIGMFLAAVGLTLYLYLALFHHTFPFQGLRWGYFVSPVAALAVLAGNFAFSLAINLSAAEQTIRLKDLELDLLNEAGRAVTRQLGASEGDLAHLGLQSTTAARMGVDVEFSAALPEGLATIIGRAIGVEGCVLLQKSATGTFKAAGAYWDHPAFDREEALAILARREATGKGVETPLTLEDFRDAPAEVRSLILIPFHFREETIGALALLNKKTSKISPRKFFTDEDLRILSTLSSEASMTLENARLLDNVRSLFSDSIRALAQAVDAKDAYTHGHSERVKDYALAAAGELSFSPNECKLVELTALLHDIGKIGIPETVLNKEGKLTDEEMSIIRQHPAKGAEIIGVVRELAPIVPSIRAHHERYDGRGYPDGLAGEEIPRIGQVITVADAFDAMTYQRVYRKALSLAEAVEEIRRNRGTQFSPDVADAFLRYLEETRSGETDLAAVADEHDGA
ncbi:MAG: CHASE2 domain-containing protein [Planctomycetota bacterium]